MILKTIHGGRKPARGQVGLDLFANEDVIIRAGETKEVRLGVCVDHKKLRNIILDYYGIPATNGNVESFIKSHHLELHLIGTLTFEGLLCNPTIINLKYAGEISIVIHNPFNGKYDKAYWKDVWEDIPQTFKIEEGDRIAQILLKEHTSYLFWE